MNWTASSNSLAEHGYQRLFAGEESTALDLFRFALQRDPEGLTHKMMATAATIGASPVQASLPSQTTAPQGANTLTITLEAKTNSESANFA